MIEKTFGYSYFLTLLQFYCCKICYIVWVLPHFCPPLSLTEFYLASSCRIIFIFTVLHWVHFSPLVWVNLTTSMGTNPMTHFILRRQPCLTSQSRWLTFVEHMNGNPTRRILVRLSRQTLFLSVKWWKWKVKVTNSYTDLSTSWRRHRN